VKIHADDPIGACPLNHVGQEFSANSYTRLIFPILPRVTIVGHNDGDSSCGCPSDRVDQEQKLHDVFGRRIRGLDDKDVVPSNVFIDTDKDLAVGKPGGCESAKLDAHMAANFLSEGAVCASGEEFGAVARNG
jgi:hypothetical protein